MATLPPRAVIVTRPTELDALLRRHGTRGQVAFFLETRGQQLAPLEQRDLAQRQAVQAVKEALPADWSLAEVARPDLDRFLFFPNDVVLAVGQDGLVANLAKYLNGQPVVGIAPTPEQSEGILIHHTVHTMRSVLPRVEAHDIDLEQRTMVQAHLDNGADLLALNDLFIGHRSHQSARYDLQFRDQMEFQSSSGVVIATGTGLTGWARSIMAACGVDYTFTAIEASAAFFAREPWPSRTSGTTLRHGRVQGVSPLRITSRINDGGVIFADGVEQDFLPFDWGSQVTVTIADRHLSLVA